MQTKINNKENKDHLRQHHLADPIVRGYHNTKATAKK